MNGSTTHYDPLLEEEPEELAATLVRRFRSPLQSGESEATGDSAPQMRDHPATRRPRPLTFSELARAGSADADQPTDFEVPDQSMDPAYVLEQRETVRHILSIARELPPDQKMAFVFAYVLDLSHEEIRSAIPPTRGEDSESLGATRNAVSCLLYRACKNVRNRLERQGFARSHTGSDTPNLLHS